VVVYYFEQREEQRAGVLPATCRWPRTLAEQAGTFVEDEYEANGTFDHFKKNNTPEDVSFVNGLIPRKRARC
jgi:hypothetical protein